MSHKKPDQPNKWQTESDEDFEGFVDAVEQPEAPLEIERPSYEELEEQLTSAEFKARENWDKLVRANAEFKNAEQRFQRDLQNAEKFSVEKLLNQLLPVVDSLERALEPENQPGESGRLLVEGVQLTLKLFLDVLHKYGVKQVDPTGEPFNPSFHEAMSMIPSPEHKPNTIVKTLQKGYLLHERLIRPALVLVSK